MLAAARGKGALEFGGRARGEESIADPSARSGFLVSSDLNGPILRPRPPIPLRFKCEPSKGNLRKYRIGAPVVVRPAFLRSDLTGTWDIVQIDGERTNSQKDSTVAHETTEDDALDEHSVGSGDDTWGVSGRILELVPASRFTEKSCYGK